ncbi:MAG TPA: ribosome small subunit-dependent GTPase A [Rhodocyclaceae bacterium]|nr:ribosome small subunit-dependent GTPase A [Rhodocyclaceae bacterium]
MKGGSGSKRSHALPSDATLHGLVTAAFGRHYEVSLDGERAPGAATLQCDPRGKKSVYACGDHVRVARSSADQGVIVGLEPRRNLLWRSDAFREKLIASNLTQVVVVVATEPSFSDLLVSRCITAAESERLKTLIVLNKADLEERLTVAREQLAPFARLGYHVVELSALHGAAELRRHLEGERSIFVGQSGMGKSTLTNALIPEAQAATREISEALDSGKHTTTFARLYRIDGGWLVDSPGMQAFGLAHLDPGELAHHFIEFRAHLGHCRFRDCRHDNEPGCALRTALESGAIDARRFEHYHLIRDEIEQAKRQSRGW